ncbi:MULTISPECIES: TetR/AcrR family transcriptional regulator [unclassified Paraburkholderia]|uniref:TetR/AcrR family transcriptional regulator n=1 Tax=unclassified Paraburkholderia TaxID=2615204 RepID=UPI0017A4C448|nr:MULTISPECIES: TetR/AcrR family transcriptional regulator [unclassified Paraburkholderia]MBB5447793.1 TetR/AcrR family transcriptional repressor of nem operon [Paraburkholderia sp. WSM4177]MBB5488270.1 TetR/AcrR family transcriptional repressor of nem operon [Paraburkholderia sp. WSM4180]
MDAAARRFREAGIDGASVAELMREAGMTVGGFYRHFPSREALVAEALEQAFSDLDPWEELAQADLTEAIYRYLTETHRDTPQTGCALTALMNDTARQGDDVRTVYTSRVARTVSALGTGQARLPESSRRNRAFLILSACVGAMGLARAVVDPVLSREILDSVAAELTEFCASSKV